MKPDAPAPDQRPAITVAPPTAGPGTVTLTQNGRTIATVDYEAGEDPGAVAARLAEASQASLRPGDVAAHRTQPEPIPADAPYMAPEQPAITLPIKPEWQAAADSLRVPLDLWVENLVDRAVRELAEQDAAVAAAATGS